MIQSICHNRVSYTHPFQGSRLTAGVFVIIVADFYFICYNMYEPVKARMRRSWWFTFLVNHKLYNLLNAFIEHGNNAHKH